MALAYILTHQLFQGDESGFIKVDKEIPDSSVFISKKENG